MADEKKKVERPLCLELNDAKREIFESITTIANKRNIPCFLLQNILFEALTQIKNGATNELEQANAFYNVQLAKNSNEEK